VSHLLQPRRLFATSAAVLLLLLGLSNGPAAAAPAAGHEGTSIAGTCSAAYLQPLAIGLISLGSSTPPYEYRVAGRVKVTNPSAAAGCILIVCEAEELGAGNWISSWCTRNYVSAGVSVYESYWPYLDCQNYDGTGYFRSYGRFDGSGVSVLGPPRFVCT